MGGAISQTVQYHTGAKIDEEEHGTFQFFRLDSLNLYAFRHKDESYFLDVYDKQSLERSRLIKIPFPLRDTAKFSVENLFKQDDKFQVFYCYFDKVSSTEKLEMVSFDSAGNKIGETKLIDQSGGMNQKKAGDFLVINRKGLDEFLSYGYKRSKDSFYINIDHFDYWGTRKQTQDFAAKIDDDFVVRSWLDRDFNLYHLTRNKLGVRNVKWGIKLYSPEKTEVYTIPLAKPSIEKINLSNFFKFYTDDQDNLNFISTYSTTPATNKTEGIYIARLDRENHKLINENVIPLKANNRSASSPETFSLSSGMLTAILPLCNKGLRMVFESRLETTSTLYGLAVDRQFDIGNITTTDLDSNYTVTAIHNIHKQQRTNPANYKFTGFVVLHNGGRSYFVYNELPENLQRTPDRMKRVNSSKMDETAIIFTLVDSNDDKIVRTVLIDKNAKNNVDALLPNSYLAEENTLYALRRINNDNYLIKIFLAD
jgi:hypothetical protein